MKKIIYFAWSLLSLPLISYAFVPPIGVTTLDDALRFDEASNSFASYLFWGSWAILLAVLILLGIARTISFDSRGKWVIFLRKIAMVLLIVSILATIAWVLNFFGGAAPFMGSVIT